MISEDLFKIKEYLLTNNCGYNDEISHRVILRRKGKKYSFEEHIAALIHAQLTNQTKWSRIEKRLEEIDKLFFHFASKQV